MSEWNFEPPPDIADREVGLLAVLKKLRYDLTSCQAKLTDAMKMVAALDIAEAGDRVACPRCGVKCAGPNTMAEHMYHSHGGPEPEHWLAIEAMSEEAA